MVISHMKKSTAFQFINKNERDTTATKKFLNKSYTITCKTYIIKILEETQGNKNV